MNEEFITGLTRGGDHWTPTFVITLDGKHCIGCGRCFKVCPRRVFDLVDRESVPGLLLTEDGEEDWEDDGFSDDPHMVMIIRDADDCIGCAACSRVCSKRCHKHAPWPLN